MTGPANKIIQAKLVLVGDMGTGRTSLVLRFIKGKFFDHQEPKIGAAFFMQILSLTEATVKFDIWDSRTGKDTFARAKKWIKELQDQGIPNLVMLLVANKSDLESKREIATEQSNL